MKKIILSLIFCCSTGLHAIPDIMPLQQIRPGMKGIGKTIFENNEIDTFEVEVLDVVRNHFPGRHLIVARLSGDNVERTGVASGMSGSPVYINNKLIGALAYRIGTFMKEPIAGITPIEEMLDIFAKEEIRELELPTRPQFDQSMIQNFLNPQANQNFNLIELFAGQFEAGLNKIQPIETPLIFSGIHPQLQDMLNPQLKSAGFALLNGGKTDMSIAQPNKPIEPGSAVGAVIINGDFDISAVGTVTYCDENRILAFGHPLFNSGPVNIPLAQSHIVTTLPSLFASNKYAVTTDIIGNIRQDRASGLLGVLGELSPTIPVHVAIASPTFEKKNYNFNMLKDDSNYKTLPVFFWITLINTLTSARLANGDYALKLDGKIELKDHTDVILDDFYAGGGTGFFDASGGDAAEAAYNVTMSLSALLVNEYETADVTNIDLKFKAIPGQKTARIEKIYFSHREVSAGDTIAAMIYLRPYHGPLQEIKEKIMIPRNVSTDKLTLFIGGDDQIRTWEQYSAPGKFKYDKLEQLVDLLNQRRKNHKIYFQLKTDDKGIIQHGKKLPSVPPSIVTVLDHNKLEDVYERIPEKILKEWSLNTEFDIQGGRKFDLRVRQRTDF